MMQRANMIRGMQRAEARRRALGSLGLGPFTGRGSGIVTAVSLGSLVLIAFGIYKLGRYVISGSFGPKVQTATPHAREVFG